MGKPEPEITNIYAHGRTTPDKIPGLCLEAAKEIIKRSEGGTKPVTLEFPEPNEWDLFWSTRGKGLIELVDSALNQLGFKHCSLGTNNGMTYYPVRKKQDY